MKLALGFVAAIAFTALAVMAAHYDVERGDDRALFQPDDAHDMEVMRALEGTLEALAACEPREVVLGVVENANRRATGASPR